MKALVLLALFVIAAEVIGGYECPIHSAPYHVSLNAGYHYCSGSLISSQWVLSAAHCYIRMIQVRLGEGNYGVNEGTEQYIYAAKIFRHPYYDSFNLDNDIMLIKLSQPATLNSYVQTVSLPSRCPVADEDCIVSGWGILSANGTYSNNLQCLRQPIIDDEICRNAYPFVITDNMVCAGFMHGDASSCPADSGGPLVCDGQLQGVLSWVSDCVMGGHPSVYVRVCRYNSWISGIMSSN